MSVVGLDRVIFILFYTSVREGFMVFFRELDVLVVGRGEVVGS